MEMSGGGPGESQILANESGYLRFGFEMMKAAYAEQYRDQGGAPSTYVKVNLDGVISDRSQIVFDSFVRTEGELVEPTYVPSTKENLIPLLFVLGFICMIVFSIIGCTTTVSKWLNQ